MDEQSHLVKFTTGKDNHIGNQYFLTSGDKIRYFLEEKALEHGKLNAPKDKAVNKIGHALHELDPVFKEFSTSEHVVDIAKSLDFIDCRIMQSMLIFKQPLIGAKVPPHVDSTFLYTDPPSAVGLWFALEDCTLENGCMFFAPGSHKKYQLGKRFVRKSDGFDVEMIDLPQSNGEPEEKDYIPAPVKAGCTDLIRHIGIDSWFGTSPVWREFVNKI
jgi:hypothetical protein